MNILFGGEGDDCKYCGHGNRQASQNYTLASDNDFVGRTKEDGSADGGPHCRLQLQSVDRCADEEENGEEDSLSYELMSDNEDQQSCVRFYCRRSMKDI